MPDRQQLRIVVYGLTGSGKSTSAGIVRDYFTACGDRVAVLKLAQPLYELQQQFYRIASRPIAFYEQDQQLLELIATQLRRILPRSLVDDFLRRLEATEADVIINDDLRDTQVDYPVLRQHGFRFIRISCHEALRRDRLAQRMDISTVIQSHTTSQLDAITPDAVVENSGTLAELQATIRTILEQLR